MSTELPDDRPIRGGYRLVVPERRHAGPYLISLGLNQSHVVTREEDLWGYEPRHTTLIVVDQPLLSRCDVNLLARVRAMEGMGARLLTFPEALLEVRTYVRNPGSDPGISRENPQD